MANDVQHNIVIRVEEVGCDKTAKGVEKVSKATNGLSKESQKGSASISGLGKAFVTSSLFSRRLFRGVSALGQGMASWFTEANDYVEAMNLFTVAMGSASKGAQEFVQKSQNLLGLDSKEVMEYMGTFNMMLEGFGHTTEASAMMSQQLTQLAYDLSSLYNVDVATSFRKLSSGMAGQVKGLRDYGISVTVASLKETALRHNIDLSISKMTEAQKATLRYVTIMENSQNVQNDLARTILTPANSLRVLNNQWTLAKRAMGQVISVIAVKVIPWFMALVKIIRAVAESLASLFGYKLPEMDYSGLTDASGYADDLSDGLDKATKSAKKLQRTLMGFDEINRLDAPDTGSGGAGGGNGLPADLGLDLSQYSYDFFKGLNNQADEYVGKLKRIFKIVGTIGGLIASIVIPTLAVKRAVELYDTFKKAKVVASALGLTFSSSLAPIVAVVGIAVSLGLALKNVYKNSEEFRAGIKAIGQIAKTVFGSIKNTAINLGKAILNIMPESWQKAIKDFLNYIKTNWGEVFLHVVFPPLGHLVDLIQDLGKKQIEAEKLGTTVANQIQASYSNTWHFIKTNVVNSANLIVTTFKNLPSQIGSAITSLKDTIVSIPKLVSQAVTSAWSTLKNFPSLIRQAFSNMFANFHIKLPHFSWVGSGVQATGLMKKALEVLNLPTSIPKLDVKWYAQGGYPEQGQMFVARESGAELVGNIGSRTAVMNNDQIVSAVAQGVAQAVASVMGGNNGQEVIINVDGKKLFDVMVNQNNAQVRRTGASPLRV